MSYSLKNLQRYSQVVKLIAEEEKRQLPAVEYRSDEYIENLIMRTILTFVGQYIQRGWNHQSLVDWYLGGIGVTGIGPNPILTGDEFSLHF